MRRKALHCQLPPGARSSADSPTLKDVLIRLMRLEQDQSPAEPEFISPRFDGANGATDCRDATRSARRKRRRHARWRGGGVRRRHAGPRRRRAVNSSQLRGPHGLSGRCGAQASAASARSRAIAAREGSPAILTIAARCMRRPLGRSDRRTRAALRRGPARRRARRLRCLTRFNPSQPVEREVGR